MKEYFAVVITVIFIGGTLVSLAPEGSGKRYLRLLVSLAVTGCIIMPLFSFLDGWEMDAEGISEMLSWGEENTQNYEEIYNKSLQNGAKEQAEELIVSKLYEQFSLSEKSASVEISFLSENQILTLQEIRVTLHGKGVLTDPREIVSFAEDAFGCPCTVLYE